MPAALGDVVAMAVPAAYDFKIPARRHLLVTIGQSTAAYWRERILNRDGIPDGVTFLEDHYLIDVIVSRYFALSVAGYKRRHGFPEDAKINNSKIAALFVRRAIDDGADRLFQIHPSVYNENREKLIYGEFLYRLFLNTCDADPESIDSIISDKATRQALKKELRYCLTNVYPASEEWLAVTAFALCAQFGAASENIA